MTCGIKSARRTERGADFALDGPKLRGHGRRAVGAPRARRARWRHAHRERPRSIAARCAGHRPGSASDSFTNSGCAPHGIATRRPGIDFFAVCVLSYLYGCARNTPVLQSIAVGTEREGEEWAGEGHVAALLGALAGPAGVGTLLSPRPRLMQRRQALGFLTAPCPCEGGFLPLWYYLFERVKMWYR